MSDASNRRPGRQIRGPQSALTDFLASHNINATQIRADALARRSTALPTAANNQADEPSSSSVGNAPIASKRRNENMAQQKKRKKNEESVIAALKTARSIKRQRQFESSNNYDEVSDQGNGELQTNKSKFSMSSEMTNCEICGTRFLPSGHHQFRNDCIEKGPICLKCSNIVNRKERAAKRPKNQALGAARRKNASNILDGENPGMKNLVDLCVETLANHVHEAESFGNLPLDLIQKLGAILSKRRLITSSILDLFLEQKHDTLVITDAAKLNSDDYCRIFQLVPSIRHLKLRNAVQFKNKVMDFLLGTTVDLISLDLHGANLIDDERWDHFLQKKASNLRTLKVHFTDSYFGDRAVKALNTGCPELERLKISHNAKVSDDGLEYIAQLSNLKHLSLELYRPQGTKPVSSAPLVKILTSVGHKLCTFSLENVTEIGDEVFIAIHKNCQQLKKLRISNNQELTDEGFVNLFTDWSNPPLNYIDFSECRHVDASNPRANDRNIGLCSLGFKAMMSHSEQSLKYLDISSCRHISLEAFETIFTTEKKYPNLEQMNVSFCQAVSDFVVGCIFRSCPKLKILTVFGCFGVRDVKVPKGKILIGTPNALGMQIEGTDD